MATTLIIGSNRGIGLELCKQLAARGDRVIAACRRSSDALDALDGVEVHAGVDVTDRGALDALAGKLGDDSVDCLLVVAGVLQSVSLDAFDVDVVRNQLEINAIGPVLATIALLPALKSEARVGLLTSRMGSITDNTSGGSYGYRMSKAALNIAGVSLAHDLRDRGIAVALLHPGFVRTEMTGGNGFIDVDESSAGLLKIMDGLSLENSGRFYHQNGDELPW